MPAAFTFIVSEHCSGMKLKDFLLRCGVSRRTLTRLKSGGSITLNRTPCYATVRIAAGDIVEIHMPPEAEITDAECDLQLDIVFEDQYFMIINKPPNMAVHPSTGNHGNTLADAVLAYYAKIGIHTAYRPVNHLDKGTSGLLIVSKDAHIHKLFSDQMQSGLLKRSYYAIMYGEISPKSGVIDLPIARKEGSILMREVSISGKSAITHYKTLQTNSKLSLMKIQLQTGRTHQIRVHFSHLGHPLVGDWLYGIEDGLINRPALHSFYLKINHPITGEEMEFQKYTKTCGGN